MNSTYSTQTNLGNMPIGDRITTAMMQRVVALADPFHPYGAGLTFAAQRLRTRFTAAVASGVFREGQFHSANDLTAATANHKLPEAAFLGRSNAGKSSLLNALTNQRVAVASRTPGRTQSLGVVRLGGALRLVDLPGYGHGSRETLMHMVGDYMKKRKALRLVCLLVDARVGPKEVDAVALQLLLTTTRAPVRVLLSKADTLSDAGLRSQVRVAEHDERGKR